MYVSYLLDKDTGMYSNSVRHPSSQTTNSPNFMSLPSQYVDFNGYHHGLGDPHHFPTTGVWNPAYAAPREEWSAYAAGFPGSSPAASGQFTFNPPGDLTSMLPPAPGTLASLYSPDEQYSPNSHRRTSYDCNRRSVHPSNPGGKTRTKDKYRVVYTDEQRLELEKEFQYSRYITIRRKAELAGGLSLSERQVKIWFQNRRAKERKMNKKKLQLSQQASASVAAPGNITIEASSNSCLLSETISMTIKEEY